MFSLQPSSSSTVRNTSNRTMRRHSISAECETTGTGEFGWQYMKAQQQDTLPPNAVVHCTWETKGPVSTPRAEDRNSCVCGSALPSGPTATMFISANPGMVAKLSVGRSICRSLREEIVRKLLMNVAPAPAQTKARDPCRSPHTLRCMVTKSLHTNVVQYWLGPKPATYRFSLKGTCVGQDETKRVSFSGTHASRTLEAILRQTSRQQVRGCQRASSVVEILSSRK